MAKEIRLPAPHPGLRPRREGDLRRPSHPGTAVRMGDGLFEVVAAERSGGEWTYRLEPWPEQEVIRTVVRWSDDDARDFAAGLRAEKVRARRNFLVWGAQIFLGFLPAENQERLAESKGLVPSRATFWSAAVESLIALPAAFPFLIGLVAGGIGGARGWPPAWLGLLAAVALGDGLVRLVSVVATGEPMGSVFLVLLGLRLKSKETRPTPTDEILEIGETLEIVSPGPKAWWERAGGVTYKGEPYVFAGRVREGRKQIYRFRKGGAGFPVLDPELEAARNRASDLSYVFAILWGFLPPEAQDDLEFYGRYRSRPYVLISLAINGLIALALIGPGLKGASEGRLEAWSLIKLAAAVYLLAECILRFLQLLKDGRPSGSVVGLLIRPFYERAVGTAGRVKRP